MANQSRHQKVKKLFRKFFIFNLVKWSLTGAAILAFDVCSQPKKEGELSLSERISDAFSVASQKIVGDSQTETQNINQ